MINYHANLVSALNTVLPTHYELALTNKTTLPCISYQERNNYDTTTGETLGYSKIIYTIKVWDYDIAEIQRYVLEIDRVLRPLGFTRTSSNELADKLSMRIQKILTYEADALENY